MQAATVSGRAIGYTRLSVNDGKNGAGLVAQEEVIRRACADRGWVLAEVLTDHGCSGGNVERPELRWALERLRPGDALVVAKLDRLTRSLFDFADLSRRAQGEGWALVALDVGFDTSTPQGEAMANMTATFAQLERRMIGQRIREALAVKREQGVRLGRPPKPTDPEVRRRIRELRDMGLSYRGIADRLNTDETPTAGGGRWHPNTVKRAEELRDAAPLSGDPVRPSEAVRSREAAREAGPDA